MTSSSRVLFVVGELRALSKGCSWPMELGAGVSIWSVQLPRVSTTAPSTRISKERAAVTVHRAKRDPPRHEGTGLPRAGPVLCSSSREGPCQAAEAALPGADAGMRCACGVEGGYPSAPNLVRAGRGNPVQLKSSFGSLIKKQGSQHQGIDFH